MQFEGWMFPFGGVLDTPDWAETPQQTQTHCWSDYFSLLGWKLLGILQEELEEDYGKGGAWAAVLAISPLLPLY